MTQGQTLSMETFNEANMRGWEPLVQVKCLLEIFHYIVLGYIILQL